MIESILHDIRRFFIKLLVGKWVVVLNAEIRGSLYVPPDMHVVVENCTFYLGEDGETRFVLEDEE